MIQIPDNIKQLLEKSICAFSTVDSISRPNTVAVACCKLVSPNQVLITDNFFNKTRTNLSTNQQVSLSFWDPVDGSNNAGYQLKGFVEIFTNGPWKEAVDKDPDNAGLSHKAAILMTVSEIWDLANPGLISQG